MKTTLFKSLLSATFVVFLSNLSHAETSINEAELIDDAEQGSVEARIELANHYLNEELSGTRVSRLKAFRWVKGLAEEGDVSSQILLANLFYYGVGTSSDEQMTVEWYSKAATSGNVEAQAVLANMYYWGATGIESSKSKALEWGLKAAEQGNAGAQRLLGRIYDSTSVSGPGRDVEKSIKWNVAGYESYKKLAEAGDIDAQLNLADIYFYGIEGFMQNFDRVKAFQWHLKAAEQGNIVAQIAVADAYRKGGIERPRGNGVEKDEAKAIEWYQKAAEQGSEEAQKTLKNTYSIEIETTEPQQ